MAGFNQPGARFEPLGIYSRLGFKMERKVNFTEFEASDIAEDTLWSRQFIRSAGWSSLFDPHPVLYPRLVMAFYANMQIPGRGDPTLRTNIDGQALEFTAGHVGHWLGLSDTPPPIPAVTIQDDPVPYIVIAPATDTADSTSTLMLRQCGRVCNHAKGIDFHQRTWLIGHLLMHNVWGHGHDQQYRGALFRAMYQIHRQQYPDLGVVIWHAFKACARNCHRPHSHLVKNVSLGHLITRMLLNAGLQVRPDEPTGTHIYYFHWGNWVTIRTQRQEAVRARLAGVEDIVDEEEAAGEGGEDTVSQTPTQGESSVAASRRPRRRRHQSAEHTEPPPATPAYLTEATFAAAYATLLRKSNFQDRMLQHLTEESRGRARESDAQFYTDMENAAAAMTSAELSTAFPHIYPPSHQAPRTPFDPSSSQARNTQDVGLDEDEEEMYEL